MVPAESHKLNDAGSIPASATNQHIFIIMVSLILITLAAILNAAMDTINARYFTSVLYNPKWPKFNQFTNPAESWKIKWKNGDRTQGEKFFGSSTFLVWTTDFWHLAKTIMLLCFALAIVCYTPIIHPLLDWIIYWIGFGTIFELFWSKIFLKK